jgi:acetyl-CoA acetyltransferase
MLGDAQFGLAGGAESMSRAPYIVPDQRWGAKMGDIRTQDMMLGALNCPFGTGHMGVTAENVAGEHGISRADQDAFALQSQERAAAAIAAGYFDSQIVPVPIRSKRETVDFIRDEHPKATTAEALAALPQSEIAAIRAEAQSRIYAKWPQWLQANIALGLDPDLAEDCTDDIAAVRSASNTAEAAVESATTLAELEAVSASWPVL